MIYIDSSIGLLGVESVIKYTDIFDTKLIQSNIQGFPIVFCFAETNRNYICICIVNDTENVDNVYNNIRNYLLDNNMVIDTKAIRKICDQFDTELMCNFEKENNNE